MKQKPRPQRPRNLLHDHPLLSKGHVHEKSQKSARQTIKRALRRGEADFHSAFGERTAEIRPAPVMMSSSEPAVPAFGG